MLTYAQIYAMKQRTIAQVKATVKEHCPHIKLRWNPDIQEFRVAYKGLLTDREEAMAQYIDCSDYDDHKTEGFADVLGAAMTMERDYTLHVFTTDKTEETRNLEFLEALRDKHSEGPE
jgi:hypothetical protein